MVGATVGCAGSTTDTTCIGIVDRVDGPFSAATPMQVARRHCDGLHTCQLGGVCALPASRPPPLLPPPLRTNTTITTNHVSTLTTAALLSDRGLLANAGKPTDIPPRQVDYYLPDGRPRRRSSSVQVSCHPPNPSQQSEPPRSPHTHAHTRTHTTTTTAIVILVDESRAQFQSPPPPRQAFDPAKPSGPDAAGAALYRQALLADEERISDRMAGGTSGLVSFGGPAGAAEQMAAGASWNGVFYPAETRPVKHPQCPMSLLKSRRARGPRRATYWILRVFSGTQPADGLSLVARLDGPAPRGRPPHTPPPPPNRHGSTTMLPGRKN